MKTSVLTLIAVAGLHAQTLAFDAASIKTNSAGGEKRFMNTDPGRITYTNVSLQDCLKAAYNLKDFQLEGPKTIGQDRFDIVATAGSAATQEQMRLMMQALLTERFKIMVHRETRELPVYLLAQGKSKPKLKESDPSAKPDGASLKILGGDLVFNGVTMPEFADRLSNMRMDRPIVDSTGLTGRYDIRLELFDSPMEIKQSMASGEFGGAVTAAVQSQLGLKLESTKAPIEILIVDRAERVPSEN